MAARPKVLIDLNIVLDVLQRRASFHETSARVPACAETNPIDGWVAAHSVTTLFHLLAKHRSAERARGDRRTAQPLVRRRRGSGRD